MPRANEKKTKATALPAADKNSKRFITKSFKCTCQPCFLRHFYTFVTFAIVCSTYLIIRNKTIFTLLVISFVVGYLSLFHVVRTLYTRGILSVCRIVCVVVFHFFCIILLIVNVIGKVVYRVFFLFIFAHSFSLARFRCCFFLSSHFWRNCLNVFYLCICTIVTIE